MNRSEKKDGAHTLKPKMFKHKLLSSQEPSEGSTHDLPAEEYSHKGEGLAPVADLPFS